MKILIKGAGDLATGIAYELWLAGHQILMTELAVPLTVRRMVSFSRAVYEGKARVEQAVAVRIQSYEEVEAVWKENAIPVIVDESASVRTSFHPDVLIDAVMAKKNRGTSIEDAPMVIGIGPGFEASRDCHCVIETQRGERLGQIIRKGCAIPDTGIPGEVGGYGKERLLRASADGVIEPKAEIGDIVEQGQVVALTGSIPVCAELTGIVRGMLQPGVTVKKGMKIGDVDARQNKELCYTISDKARKIGRSVVEALLL